MRVLSKSIILILSMTAMVASGGGGGDSDVDGSGAPAARAPLALDAKNGQRVAAAVVADSDHLAGDGDSLFFVPAGSSGGTQLNLQALARDMASRALEVGLLPNPEITAATAQPRPCQDGGTYTMEGTDDGAIIFDFDNCTQVDVVQNGVLTVTFLKLEGDINAPNSDWAFSAVFRFTDLTATSKNESFEFDGGFSEAERFDASEGFRTLAINGSDLIRSDNRGKARITHFGFRASEVSATSQHTLRYYFDYEAGSFAGPVLAVSRSAFTSLEGFPPDSGRLFITGAKNTSVVVEATGGGTARISIDANGDGDFVDSVDRVINGQWTTFFG